MSEHFDRKKEGEAGAPAPASPQTPPTPQTPPEAPHNNNDNNKEDGAAFDLTYRGGKEKLRAAALGFCIGLAVIVPGVSGAAVAILFGLYEKLLAAIGGLGRHLRRSVLFLLPVAAGGVVGFVVGFFAVRALLDLCPFAVVALFAGLMAGAYPAVTDNLRGERITPLRVSLFAAGALLPVLLGAAAVFLSPAPLWPEQVGVLPCLLFLVLGFLVALTQVVPGLSATALLMLCGCFAPLLDSVGLSYWRQNPAVFALYACLAAGFLLGLVLCSKGMGGLMRRARAGTFSAVAGLSLGSLLSMFLNPEIFAVYEGWAEGAPFAADLWPGVALFFAGLAASYLLVRFERKKQK